LSSLDTSSYYFNCCGKRASSLVYQAGGLTHFFHSTACRVGKTEFEHQVNCDKLTLSPFGFWPQSKMKKKICFSTGSEFSLEMILKK